MSAKHTSHDPEYEVKAAPSVKSLSLELGSADVDMSAQIKEAFDLARSAGLELDLTIGSGPSQRCVLSQSHCKERGHAVR